jgi:hypothetical protein
VQDRRGALLAGESDRRPSRPVVSPIYAQGSYYGTNRVVASAPGRFTGPAAPLLSSTRVAQPPGGDPSRAGSHVVRTGRVSQKNRTRGRGGAGAATHARGRGRGRVDGRPGSRAGGRTGREARRRRPPPARAAPKALPGPLL